MSPNPNIPYNASATPSSYGEDFFMLDSLGDSLSVLAPSKAKVDKKYKRAKVESSTPSSYSEPETATKHTYLIDTIIPKLKE